MSGGYSRRQIALHWIIVALVPIQYLTGGSIERTHHAVHMGLQPTSADILQHHIHNYCGIAIGLIMGIRLLVRLLDGAPPANPVLQTSRYARILHLAFYAIVIGQACLGFIASYLSFRVAPLHVAGSWLLLLMVGMHVAAAAWHTVVRKDDTLDRMAIPLKARKENRTN